MILAQDLPIEEVLIDKRAEVDIEVITDSVPVKDLKLVETSATKKECMNVKEHLCQLCGMSFLIQKSQHRSIAASQHRSMQH